MRKSAFTLLELMIVIIIVGILASLAIPMLQGAAIKATFVEIFSLAREHEQEADWFFLENGWANFPPAPSTLGGKYFRIDGRTIGGAPPNRVFTFSFRDSQEERACQRTIYQNGTRQWLVYPDYRWHKYLKATLPGAEYY